jgi:hypothetical protein
MIFFLFAGMMLLNQSHLSSSQTERTVGTYSQISRRAGQTVSAILLDNEERLQNDPKEHSRVEEGPLWREKNELDY